MYFLSTSPAPLNQYLIDIDGHGQNISSLNAQSRQYPLKKPGGLHWDLGLLGLTTFIASVLGLPVPGGLNPHATMHTDCLTEGRSVMCVGQPSKDGNSVKMVEKLIASYVLEQRVTHILVGLLMLLTVGTPVVYLLQYIPHAILGGVFFVLSVGSFPSSPPSLLFSLRFTTCSERFKAN